MNQFKPAEQLLLKYGVNTPSDIDVEAIAYLEGLSVRHRKLDGCDACLLAQGDRGVIIVSNSGSSGRRRFSIAHEIGHWRFHRGKVALCEAGEIERGDSSRAAREDERVADTFASELLMPSFMLNPIVSDVKFPRWKHVESLSDSFKTSWTATAIRLVRSNLWPCILICHRRTGRAWFTRSERVPSVWFPRDDLDQSSTAFLTLFGHGSGRAVRRVGAEAWFERSHASRWELEEQSCAPGDGTVLTLLTFLNPP